ncbi:MAG: DUF4105 domain-containing protein [Bacteroidales bacterium]|nr:DUF4105 domain-containing protein [Bacteroidales bacterium]
MKRIILSALIIIGLFLCNKPSYSSSQLDLSEQATISLMTCGSGESMYSMFGHSALWVHDPINRIDRVYNYGTFDFSDPNFYYLFIRGIANYKLSVTSSGSFMNEYFEENRTVEQQALNLTISEKQTLFDALEENYKPENRYYRYDFLFLNCSSVIRDKVFESLSSTYRLDQTSYDQSFRDLLQPYLTNSWIKLGINLLLGPRAERKASNQERMFLPDLMHEQFELAHLANKESLAPNSQMLYLSTNATAGNSSSGLSLAFFVLFVLIGVITKKKFNNHRWNNGLDFVIFMLSGLIGLLLSFMWFFSEHEVVHQNLNLVWAFPLHILMGIMIWIPVFRSGIRLYSKVFFVASVIFLLLALLGVQEVPTAVLLFAGITMIRLFRLAFFPSVIHQVNR